MENWIKTSYQYIKGQNSRLRLITPHVLLKEIYMNVYVCEQTALKK